MGGGAAHPPPQTRPLIWRFLFITYLKHAPMCLKHAPSFDESGSSYIYNTPSHLASPVHNISYTRPIIWQFRLLICLKHGPSFGHPGSSCILNTPPHLATPVHHVFFSSCVPSFLPCFLTSFLPSFPRSWLLSFLPAFLSS